MAEPSDSENVERARGSSPSKLVPSAVRSEVLSGTRIRIAFFATSVSLVAALSLMTVLSIDRVFKWLTPIAHDDLFRKTERGLLDLTRATDIGVLLRDPLLLREATRPYQQDPDVRYIVIEDVAGSIVYSYGREKSAARQPFAGAPDTVHEQEYLLRGWTRVSLEGQDLGRIALGISTDRLRAGAELRSEVLWSALGVGLVATLMSFLFVRVYVTPLLSLSKRAFLDLERRTQDALEATRTKSRFLANVSHELRTPLNGILGMTALLLRGELSKKQRRQAQIVATASQSLLTLINDLLDFSAVEAGRMRLNATSSDLRELVQSRMELLAIGTREKALEVGYHVCADVPRIVRLDADRLEQVITNVVGNAIKFTFQGEVELTLSMASREAGPPARCKLRFEVRDTGPGIAEHAQHELFQAFAQLDTSASRKFEGTGLGLAISKHLVQLMGGGIGVLSEPGVGSTFWFTLEAEIAEDAPATAARTESACHPRLLVVDASPMYCRLLSEAAEGLGIPCTATRAAEHALTLMAEAEREGAPFGMALVDLRLSQTSEALREALHAAERAGTTRVALLVPAWWGATPGDQPAPHALMAKPVRSAELRAFLLRSPRTDTGRLSQERLRAIPQGSVSDKAVLVVDDNEVGRLFAEEVVRERNHACVLAESGKQAIEAFRKQRFDLVLMDCQMPGMNGYETTRLLRVMERELGYRTPIVALTAHALPEEAQRVRDAGMDELMTKPISPERLEALLERYLHPSSDTEGLPPTLQAHRRSARLIEVFLRTVPEHIEALKNACQEESMPETGKLAHRLRGSAVSIGAARMAALCSSVESACAGEQSSELSQVRGWVAAIGEDFVQLQRMLLAEVSGGSTPGPN